MPGKRRNNGGEITMRNDHIAPLAMRLRRSSRLKSSPKRRLLIEISKRSKMELLIQKVADRMDEKRGAGQMLKISLQKWYIERGPVSGLSAISEGLT
jgi:hypothetical protein